MNASGGGTRAVDHGASVTRFALPISPWAARCAIMPAGPAITGTLLAIAVTSAAIWTTPIKGTAIRLSTSPAPVTREKSTADTGSSAISTASDAKTDATTHDSVPAR